MNKGDLNSKLHAVSDAQGRAIQLFLTAGNASDYIGARAIMGPLPQADWLLADRGYVADWFRKGLKDMEIEPCIPSRRSRTQTIAHDKTRYKLRHKIENKFVILKDWRRIATCYGRRLELFLLAIALAATVVFWL